MPDYQAIRIGNISSKFLRNVRHCMRNLYEFHFFYLLILIFITFYPIVIFWNFFMRIIVIILQNDL